MVSGLQQETGEHLLKARSALEDLRELLKGTATAGGHKAKRIEGDLNTLTVAIAGFEALQDTLRAMNNQSEVALFQARNIQKLLTAPVANGDEERGGKGE